MDKYITGDNIAVAILAVVVCAWLVTQLLTARKQIRELQGEKQRPFDRINERLEKIEEKLDNDNRRIEALQARTGKQDEELRLILRAEMAMMSHIVNGNSIDRIIECRDSINDYLTGLH